MHLLISLFITVCLFPVLRVTISLMDSLTHALTGVVIAKAINDKKVGNWGTIAGLTMGVFPDSDFVLGLFNRQFYIEYHRDFTHSLILIPFYALFFSWLFVKVSKRPHFWSFYRICLPVLVSHVVLDLLTSYGTMVLSPFFKTRFSLDLVFIVDLIFSGIIVFPLVASFIWKRRSQWICRGSLVGLALYIFFCGVQHHDAMKSAEAFARNLDENVVQVASLPQPLSPFRWANYVETRSRIYQGFIDLLKKKHTPEGSSFVEPIADGMGFRERLRRLNGLFRSREEVRYLFWQKNQDSPWVERALTTKGTRFYYWFARFPVVYSVNSNHGTHRVEFIDVRFLLPGIRTPFKYYVEFDDSGRIRSEGFAEDGRRP